MVHQHLQTEMALVDLLWSWTKELDLLTTWFFSMRTFRLPSIIVHWELTKSRSIDFQTGCAWWQELINLKNFESSEWSLHCETWFFHCLVFLQLAFPPGFRRFQLLHLLLCLAVEVYVLIVQFLGLMQLLRLLKLQFVLHLQDFALQNIEEPQPLFIALPQCSLTRTN